MPSLGSAAQGLLTFNGSWGKVRTDPAAKFMVLALVCYLGSTFEGSMMAIKSVNSLTHNTDWTIAHVHFGAIGWVAMIAIGSLYAMAPKALGQRGDAFTPRDGVALPAANGRATAVCDVHVGRRPHRGSDVARHQSRWVARL